MSLPVTTGSPVALPFQLRYKKRKRVRGRAIPFHDLRGTAISFAYANLDRPREKKIKLASEISGHSAGDAKSIIAK
ncbi:hypothetical protein [Shinella zoogloeoides]|uniref:hypothetical protein n=1 Tax=Shinella zoogloeoides TaxID=352475 RepID=UPI0028B167E6|nr:hypothetical protein [Shinella zoogloeoides]